MNIVINGGDAAYNLLTNPPSIGNIMRGLQEREREREKWQADSDDEAPKVHPIFSFNFDTSELPSPFEKTGIFFTRFGDYYKMNLLLGSRSPMAFEGVSEYLKYHFRRNGYQFLPSTPDATGYILNPDRVIVSSVMGNGENFEKRLVGFGANGSEPLKLTNLIDFQRRLKLLEKVGNCYFNGCVGALVRAKKMRALPDIVLNINP